MYYVRGAQKNGLPKEPFYPEEKEEMPVFSSIPLPFEVPPTVPLQSEGALRRVVTRHVDPAGSLRPPTPPNS